MRRLACTAVLWIALASVAAADAPTMGEVANAGVRGIGGGGVLAHGRFEGPPPAAGGASRRQVVLLDRMTAVGTVAGISGSVRAVLLAESPGGSGTFLHLALFGRREGGASNLGTALVGDRVRLRSLAIAEGAVLLDVVEAGPADPMCCPTQLARRVFRYRDGALSQAASRPAGTLSLAVLRGGTWTLEAMDETAPAPGGPPPALRFAEGSVSGFAGCNRFSGSVVEAAPGRVSVGELAATRMACPGERMAMEEAFLRALAGVSSYTFLEGRLGLAWEAGGRGGTMRFVAGP